ncbi:MAG: 16S rRNA (adenine(1518)-N(6)/adenine(1519)-N(6))-dimethyltransferase RsmA [Minisyncoccia bacterium]|jgi:16S rRNA (adenine1518-N6/adenine1519-N6)-dimethyltransferase
MQKLGQHFLKNKSVLRSIAESLELAPNDIVIEIGPGHGELTEFLMASHAEKIIAIEKDADLYDSLIKKFQDARMIALRDDALTALPTVIQNSKPKILNYKIVGNIPYYITGHLLRTIGDLEIKPTRSVFTIQKEVAERVCAIPPHMNRLAASVQFWATPRIVQVIPASDFSPKPKVASAIIILEAKQQIADSQNYYSAVHALFAQPRKTIINNLRSGTEEKGDSIGKKLSAIGISPDQRPQNLSVSDIIAISKTFF